MTTRYLSADEMLAMFPGPELAQVLGFTRAADGSYPVTDSARLEVFISMAENEADAYISTEYTLPLKSVPPVLKPMIADMARYRAYGNKVTPEIHQRYLDSVSFLAKVGNGKVLLGVPKQDDTVAQKAQLPSFNVNPKVLGVGQWDDF